MRKVDARDAHFLQRAFNALGGPGTPLKEDGIPGPLTDAATRAFQTAHGLEPTGLVDAKTEAALTAALAKTPFLEVEGTLGKLIGTAIATGTIVWLLYGPFKSPSLGFAALVWMTYDTGKQAYRLVRALKRRKLRGPANPPGNTPPTTE